MNLIWVVARKEIHQILSNRGILFSAAVFAIWLPMMALLPSLVGGTGRGAAAGSLVPLTVLVGVFMGYLFSSETFFREKKEGTIETLLCTPLSIRQFWEGKVLGVTLLACGMVLCVILLAAAAFALAAPGTLVVTGPLVVHLLVVVPLLTAAAVGLIGYAQIRLGMRANQALGMLFIFGFIFFVFMVQAIAGSTAPGWPLVGILCAGAVAMLSVGRTLAGRIAKEKIVRTIP